MGNVGRSMRIVWVTLASLAGVTIASALFVNAEQSQPNWAELSSTNGDIPSPNGGPQQTGLVVADLDNSGTDDVVLASRKGVNSLVWYRRVGSNWSTSTIEASGLPIEAGGTTHDVDGDGLTDVVMGGDRDSDTIWWWKNPGPSAWDSPWPRFTIKTSGETKHHDIVFGDFDNDGAAEFAFWNQGFSGTVNELHIAEIPVDPTTVTEWTSFVVYDAGPTSEGLVVADIDGDGDDDIAAGGVIVDDAPGGAYTITPFAPGEERYKIAVGDLVTGGGLEIVTSAGDLVGGLAFYTNDGGSWTRHDLLSGAGGSLPGPWDHGHTLEVGDVNRDGHLDIFAAEMSLDAGAAARSVMLFGDGLGGFTVDPVSTGIDNHESLLLDADGDGDLDVASKPFNQNVPAFRFFINSYSAAEIGPWTRRHISTRSFRGAWIRYGDLNGDGLLDLVTANSWHENPGTIDGTWIDHSFGSALKDAAIVHDLDGDGDLDVFGIGAGGSGILAWAENDGTGGFTTRTNIPSVSGDFLQGVAVKNTASGPEIWLAWNDRLFGIDRVIPSASPSTTPWTVQDSGYPSQGEEFEWVDVDDDGDLDLLQGHMWSRTEAGGGRTDFILHSPTLFDFSGQPANPTRLPDRVQSADMNGDGRLDVVVSHEFDPTNSVAWFEQPVDPTQLWTEHPVIEAALPIHSLDVGDVDGDGDPDIVIGEHDASGDNDGRVLILQNMSGDADAWRQLLVHDGESNHDGTQFVDLDGDGDLDIATIGWRHNRTVIHENRTTTLAAPVWHDAGRRYRIDLDVPGPPVAVTDHPAVVGVNLTAALADAGGIGAVDHLALRVAEVDGAGALIDAQVPFQFDPGPDFDAGAFATGELVVLLDGVTPAGTSRHFQLYFDVTGAGASSIPVTPLLTTTPGVVDAGLPTVRVETATATWFFDPAGGGFTSLVDADGNDWIGYSAAARGEGEFRGVPNLVPPAAGGHFHPGVGTAVSTITHSGPLRTTIESVVPGTTWSMRWNIYPDWATGVVTGAAGSYWFQYEGTPGGSLGGPEDSVHRSGGTTIAASQTFEADLPDPEWMAAADSTVDRQLVVSHGASDGSLDSYRPFEGAMTVMAFGRASSGTIPLFAGADRSFTLGLNDGSTLAAGQTRATTQAWSPPTAVIRSISIFGVNGPGGSWDGGSAPTTTVPPTTVPPTTVPGTTLPPTTVSPPGQAAIKFSFGGAAPPSGWILAKGDLFSGSHGWHAADGLKRQCGTRNNHADRVLDTFCHATTRYVQTNGQWNGIASPASWSTDLANGSYAVTVTVGESKSHSSSIAHSVQAEGVVVHDRVSTSNSTPFRVATVPVTVTDGSLDLTFAGGTRTKIVSVEIAPAGTPPTTTTTTTSPTTTTTTSPTTTTTTSPTTTSPTTTSSTTTTTSPTTTSSTTTTTSPTTTSSTTSPTTTSTTTSSTTTTTTTTTPPTTTSSTTTSSTTTTSSIPTTPGDPIQYSFSPRNAPNGWIVASGDAFDGFHGWTMADGQRRQCGTRNVNPDLVLDTFCHATTRYVQTNGSWNAVASPASWGASVPNGTYEVTVTVGDAGTNPSDVAHSVQAEGMIVHDRVPTSNSSRFATATITVVVTDGQLDLTFVGGTKTKVVSVVLVPMSPTTTTVPPSSTTTTITTTTSSTTTTTSSTTTITTTTPSTTAPPSTVPTGEPLRYNFSAKALSAASEAAGWMLATGDLFDGSLGWDADDGDKRQCGTRNANSDPILDTFCHATTRYSNPNGVWIATNSPATWQVVIPNGTYLVSVTVGDTSSSPSAVRHSVQVETVEIHDRAITTSSNRFETAEAVVVINDGVADVTFDGGNRTKIVSIEFTPVS